MGRRWSRKRKNEDASAKKEKKGRKPAAAYSPTVAGNAKMESYYALQGLHNEYLDEETQEFITCETEEQKEKERMRWMTSLRTMLPASFRIGTDVDKVLRENLEQEIDKFVGTEMEIFIDPEEGRRGNAPEHPKDTIDEGDALVDNDKNDDPGLVTKKVAPVRRIPFIPHGYQLSMDRRTIRRNPALNKFHGWLMAQTSSGFVTRQETVSMIPPVVLSVEPHHSVLDMCAAPGSKTSQILEIVSSPTESKDLEPRGCVVANDSDAKRAYMLVHQLRRINSPVALITSCDAQFFPLLKDGKGEGMFDRVLCDVPCSGDGTTRKNPGIWRHWSALGSLALHPLQLGIALNGARLTKVGGYLCYSTCAMNPIENEAIVAELLRAADGSLELVDKRPDMPGLKARPGWSSWRVLREDKSRKEMKDRKKKNNAKMQKRRKEWEEKKIQENGQESKSDTAQDDAAAAGDSAMVQDNVQDDDSAEQAQNKRDSNRFASGPPPSWDEATLKERASAQGLVEYTSFDEVPEEWQSRVRKTVFPPTEEEAAKFRLKKCLRCLPHDMDTGGFFVALLRKVAPLSAKAKREALELAQEFHPEEVGDDGPSGPVAKRSKAEESDLAKTGGMDKSEAVIGTENDDGIDTDMFDATEADDTDLISDAQLGDTTDADNEDMVSESDPKEKDDTKVAPSKVMEGKPLKRGKTRGVAMDDSFVPLNDDIWKPLVDYYGLSETFPRDQYMARAFSEAKALYFVGAPIKNLMDRGIQERVTIVNTGLKGFARNNKECKVVYRVAQEGIHYLAPHMTKRKIYAGLKDFSKCLNTGTIRLENFTDEFAAAVRLMDPGSFVVALEGYEEDIFQKMFLVMWRCRGDAVNCLVAKVEMEGMKSKLRAIPGYEEEKVAVILAAGVPVEEVKD